MNTKRVEVFHVAYGDAVVVFVANDFVFNLLPSFEALLYENLRRERESFFSKFVEFFFVVAEA